MEELLPYIWLGIVGLAVALYVVLDGFDLGIGILFPALAEERDRDRMMDTIAPYWDGNETWLVLGGGGLLVAFPKAYAALMPAVYLPIIFMLLSLVFRGVSFEFRHNAKPGHQVWDRAFAAGSIGAAFFQGVVLGAVVQGVHTVDGRFAGGALDWLTPFSLMCGLGVVAGYALLGAGWLVARTDGELAAAGRRFGRRLVPAVLVFFALVSLWTPIAQPAIAARWFSLPNILYLWPVPLATAALAWTAWTSFGQRGEYLPFFASIGLFLLAFLGLAISLLPAIVPPDLTFLQASSPPETQRFLLAGTMVLLPLMIGYFALVYWIFRGKVAEGHYH